MTELGRVFIDTAPLIYYLQKDEIFFTNDKRLRQFDEIKVMTLDDFNFEVEK